MYICLSKNENTSTIIQKFLENNVSIDVDKTGSLVWIHANLKEKNYLAYVNVKDIKSLIICSSESETIMKISLDDINTIYNLD